eukprot:CAMPEP_0196591136 /NCGR_PEP_ID=MMETSP1081-20130531/68644_1 /TAXON_ID=36882 /ORGANISM="Pyramimonas amylifera, Strain CCMP720" /LENGTH=86 /DNA_ID=CAMNT_0041914413 /DNA_START=173 /DNA_END=430 /DNA_ORIENTATION=+
MGESNEVPSRRAISKSPCSVKKPRTSTHNPGKMKKCGEAAGLERASDSTEAKGRVGSEGNRMGDTRRLSRHGKERERKKNGEGESG